MSRVCRGTHGASLAEYGLVLGLIGLVGIPVAQRMGSEVAILFSGSADAVSYASITVEDSLDPEAFVFEVSTDTGAIFPSAGGTIEIDWGDETANETCTTTYVIDPNSPLTCNYPEAGTYRIAITGDMTGYGQLYSAAYKTDITRMIQWGNTGLNNLSYAFYGAEKLTDVPSHLPSGVQDINGIFAHTGSLNDASISAWDTSNVTTMAYAFQSSAFNRSLGGWNTSQVTDFHAMFLRATAFDQDLSNWDTSSVTTMRKMFRDTQFNGDLSDWNTSNVQSLQGMFRGAGLFNQDISNWDVSSVTNFYRMFYESSSFAQDLSGWDTGAGTNFESMFFEVGSFNSDLSSWDMSSAVHLFGMFRDASSFNADISGWNVSGVNNMRSMFEGASSFSADISGWDVSSVTNMDSMFLDASAFSRDLSGWCVGLISSRPANFSSGSGVTAEPVWGTCP